MKIVVKCLFDWHLEYFMCIYYCIIKSIIPNSLSLKLPNYKKNQISSSPGLCNSSAY